jgi:multidrug resistance efflux pump
MPFSKFAIGTSLVAATCAALVGAFAKQEPNELERRVELLELRVQKLEGILFSTAQLTVLEARQELEQATTRYESRRKLHLKGYITKAQLNNDRFQVDQAQRELELARAETNQQQISDKIDLSEAKRNLQVAKENLSNTQRLFERGFVSEREVQADEDEVRRFQRRLDLAETKASAARELMNLKPGQNQPDEAPEAEKAKPNSGQSDKQ